METPETDPIPSNQFVVGDYLIKAFKLKDSSEEDQNNHRSRFLDLLKDMGFDWGSYDWDTSCGDPTVDHVTIYMGDWNINILFEFDRETGKYRGLFLEEQ